MLPNGGMPYLDTAAVVPIHQRQFNRALRWVDLKKELSVAVLILVSRHFCPNQGVSVEVAEYAA